MKNAEETSRELEELRRDLATASQLIIQLEKERHDVATATAIAKLHLEIRLGEAETAKEKIEDQLKTKTTQLEQERRETDVTTAALEKQLWDAETAKGKLEDQLKNIATQHEEERNGMAATINLLNDLSTFLNMKDPNQQAASAPQR